MYFPFVWGWGGWVGGANKVEYYKELWLVYAANVVHLIIIRSRSRIVIPVYPHPSH